MSIAWLTPAALAGLVLLAVPIAIHLFARAPIRRIVVPSLRPVAAQVPRLRRRRHLRDPWLLAVRLLTVAAAVAASAGPLLVTPAREAQWRSRVARALIVDGAVAVLAAPGVIDQAISTAASGAIGAEVFTAEPPDSAIPAALAWLSAQPPARREVVVIGDDGSAPGPSALAMIPAETGVTVEIVPVAATADVRSWLGASMAGRPMAARVTAARDAAGLRTRLEATPPPQVPVAVVAAAAQAVVDAVWDGVQAEGAFLRAAATWQPVRIEWLDASPVSAASLTPLTADERARLWPLATLPVAMADASSSPPAPWSPLAPGISAARDGATLVIRSLYPPEPALIAPTLRAALQVAAGEDRAPRPVGAADARYRAAIARPATGVPSEAIRYAAGADARWVWAVALAGLVVESALRRRRDHAAGHASGAAAETTP